jgi:signal transduction histidine kinase
MKRSRNVQFPIRLQMLFIILPVAIIPLLILVFSITGRIYSYLEHQKFKYYSIVLEQVGWNIDFLYNQYAVTMATIYELDSVTAGLLAPPYRSMKDEERVSLIITGNETSRGGLREIAREKVDGALFLYETDRESLIDNTSYKLHYGFDTSMYIQPPVYEEMIEDPLFQALKMDNSIRMALGMFRDSVIPGLGGNEKSVIIFPWYQNPPVKKSDTFTKFILLVLNIDFLPRVYKDIGDLNPGSLFILDRYKNVMSASHPSSDDYYNYNSESGKYELGDDLPNDPDEMMSFSDYSKLLTDANVMQSDDFINQLSLTGPNTIDEKTTQFFKINWNGIEYLTLVTETQDAGALLVYFLPVQHVLKPIYSILYIIAIVSLISIIVVILVSIFASKSFTLPIKQLLMAADHLVRGRYGYQIEIHASNELGHLADTFNRMSSEILDRSEKLNEANRRLSNLDKVKSLFFHSISHQLRTPISQITGFNALLMNRSYDPMFTIAEIHDEMLGILEEAESRNPGSTKIHLEHMKLFKESILDKNLTFFDYYINQVEANTFGLGEEAELKMKQLIDEARAVHKESIEKQVSVVKKIHKTGESLTTLLDSISKISLLDAFAGDKNLESCHMKEFLEEVCKEGAGYVEKFNKTGHLKVVLDLRDTVSESLCLDQFRVKTILDNLVYNAVQYSEEGIVTISMTEVESDAGKWVHFSVTDNGIGIRQEEQEQIFDEFGKTSDTKDTESPGLGLALSRKIADMMNGSITVQSVYGEGSTFTLKIPVEDTCGS